MTRLSVPRFGRDARSLIIVSGLFSLSFYGIQQLLRVLYVLRLGHGPEYIGIFSASGAFTYMAMGLPSGALGERFGTRRIMLVGGIITTLGMTVMPLVEFVPLVARYYWPIASQVLLIMGWAMLNVNIVPSLMAVTGAGERNSAYAVNGALRGLGTFLGTVAGGLLPALFAGLFHVSLDDPAPYRYGLWVGALLAGLAVVPVILMPPVKRTSSRVAMADRGPFPALLIALLIVHIFLSHGGWATCQAFCNAYMDTDLHLPASAIGLITGAAQFAGMLAVLWMPRLARRRSTGWTLMVTSLGMAISMVPLALIPQWVAAGVGRLGVLGLDAVWLPALQVFQMERVSAQWRSLAYGAASMAMGLSYGAVSLAGGFLIVAAGYRSVFLLGGGLCLAGAVVMQGILRRKDAMTQDVEAQV